MELVRGSFPSCALVDWGDVIKKVGNEFDNKTVKYITDVENAPSFVLHNSFLPGTLKNAWDEVRERFNVSVVHVYLSLGTGSPTFGKHKDEMNVLLVQSIGSMTYLFESEPVVLKPSDSIFIKGGEYHEPRVTNPRVTLSFSWE
jgi:hypothetical protein